MYSLYFYLQECPLIYFQKVIHILAIKIIVNTDLHPQSSLKIHLAKSESNVSNNFS